MLILGQRIAVLSGVWALVSLLLLAIVGSLTLEYLFVLDLLGFLIILMLFGPLVSRPGWRTRAGVVTSIGVLIFALIVLEKVSLILPIKLF